MVSSRAAKAKLVAESGGILAQPSAPAQEDEMRDAQNDKRRRKEKVPLLCQNDSVPPGQAGSPSQKFQRRTRLSVSSVQQVEEGALAASRRNRAPAKVAKKQPEVSIDEDGDESEESKDHSSNEAGVAPIPAKIASSKEHTFQVIPTGVSGRGVSCEGKDTGPRSNQKMTASETKEEVKEDPATEKKLPKRRGRPSKIKESITTCPFSEEEKGGATGSLPQDQNPATFEINEREQLSAEEDKSGDSKLHETQSKKRLSSSEEAGSDSSGGKRPKVAGVRVVGGRIYDSENGTTCHQCRQKALEYMAPCRSVTGQKGCTQKYCAKCLLNRYGEKVDDVSKSEDWCCPRCRGVCNCSICMKKQGRLPTGILTHTAKATGYGSVAELLEQHPGVNQESLAPSKTDQAGFEAKANCDVPASTGATNLKTGVSEALALESSGGKETIVDPKVTASGAPPGRVGQPMRMPRRQRWVPAGILAKVDEVVVPVAAPIQYQIAKVEVQKVSEPEEPEIVLPEGTPLMTVAGMELPEKAVGPALQFLEFCGAFAKALGMKKGEGEKALQEIVKGFNTKRGAQSPAVQVHVRLLNVILYESEEPCNVTCALNSKNSWLDVSKRYLHNKISSHTKEIELKDAEGEHEKARKDAEIAAESNPTPSSSTTVASVPNVSVPSLQDGLDNIASALEHGADAYGSLTIDQKLQFLNMLCNDALCTTVLRSHIEVVMAEYEDDRREKREKSKAAKKEAKETQEKQKETKLMRMLATGKNQGLLSQEEQSAYVTKLRAEAIKGSTSESIDAKALATEEAEPERSDAVKTEAVVWDKGARAVWKLKGGNDRSSVVLQDITNIDGILREKWSVYSEKDEEVLAAYITQRKNGRHRRRPRKRYQLVASSEKLDGATTAPTLELTKAKTILDKEEGSPSLKEGSESDRGSDGDTGDSSRSSSSDDSDCDEESR